MSQYTHKTSRKLGGDWITVKQSRTFRNVNLQSFEQPLFDFNENDFYKVGFYSVDVETDFKNSFITSIIFYDANGNRRSMIYDYVNNGTMKGKLFFPQFGRWYMAADASFKPMDNTTEYKGLFLVFNQVGTAQHITVTTTVKYLNFDS